MDAIIRATAWHDMGFFKTAHGDVYRIWMHTDGLPLLERLTSAQLVKYREAVSEVSTPAQGDFRQ